MKHSSPISASRLYVGMDVHKRTIALCVYDSDRGIVIDERELKHDLPKVRKYLERLQRRSREIRCCYEASSCGYGLHRVLEAQGIRCEVIAPSSIPRRSGDRVKTDRRDAQKLAILYAAGLLTPVHVTDSYHEAVHAKLIFSNETGLIPKKQPEKRCSDFSGLLSTGYYARIGTLNENLGAFCGGGKWRLVCLR